MNFKKRINGSWVDTPNYIHNTSTDTITTLPAVVYANGTTATVGLKGQTVQSSIPSPTSPVIPQGTGERTGNLWDGDYQKAILSISGSSVTYYTGSSGRVAVIPCSPSTQYTAKKYGEANRFIIAESEIKPSGGDTLSLINNNSALVEYTFTTGANTHYVTIYVSTSSEQAEPPLMLNTGSTPLPYEPYGYKIPISSANTTTPVYLGEVESTRQIKKLVLTGEEGWNRKDNCFIISLADSSNTVGRIISTHFEYKGTWNLINIDSTGACTSTTYYSTNYKYLMVRCDNIATSVNDFNAWLSTQYAAGTPVTIWYVLATPQTAVVNEPIRKIGDYADEVSGITIPTIAGANTLSIGTTLQPSEVTVNYKGWHPVADVHEADNGAWTQ